MRTYRRGFLWYHDSMNRIVMIQMIGEIVLDDLEVR